MVKNKLMSSRSLPAKFDLSHGWMRWGVTGLTAFSLATILSLRPIRQKVFEFFLVTHIILIGYVLYMVIIVSFLVLNTHWSSIFLVGGYLHTRDPG